MNAPDGYGCLLPRKHGTRTHASELVVTPVFEPKGGGFFLYPSMRAVCGTRGSAEGEGPITCTRCVRLLSLREERGQL